MKTEEERQEKRREEKTKEDKTREERRFIYSVVVHGRFFVGVVIFWLIPFAHET